VAFYSDEGGDAGVWVFEPPTETATAVWVVVCIRSIRLPVVHPLHRIAIGRLRSAPETLGIAIDAPRELGVVPLVERNDLSCLSLRP
jgi:hypothetical protein